MFSKLKQVRSIYLLKLNRLALMQRTSLFLRLTGKLSGNFQLLLLSCNPVVKQNPNHVALLMVRRNKHLTCHSTFFFTEKGILMQ